MKHGMDGILPWVRQEGPPLRSVANVAPLGSAWSARDQEKEKVHSTDTDRLQNTVTRAARLKRKEDSLASIQEQTNLVLRHQLLGRGRISLAEAE